MESFDLINLEEFSFPDFNFDHVDITSQFNFSGELCFYEYNDECLHKADIIFGHNFTMMEDLEDFEFFDERDLMNVIGYSVISLGKYEVASDPWLYVKNVRYYPSN